MTNQTPDPMDIAGLLQSLSTLQAQPTSSDTVDADEAVGSILRGAAYEQIPAKAAEAIPGLEIFEDGDQEDGWFWEWEWGECQDGPHENELEALIAFAKFASELAIELGGDEDEDEE